MQNTITRPEQAREFVQFSLEPRDASMTLVRRFAEIFTAKVHALQRHLGHCNDAVFIGMPDAHPLRKPEDWNAALPYGGAMLWESGAGEMFPLQAKPNCCGIYVGRIGAVDCDELSEGVRRLFQEPITVPCGSREIGCIIDICSGNHFLNVYEDEANGEWFVMVHCDTPELKHGDEERMGLYYDRPNPILHRSMEILGSSLGPVPYVAGDDCEAYLGVARDGIAFANLKRREIAKRVFGDPIEIFADVHQAIIGDRGFTLGAYTVTPGERSMVPITVAPERDAFLAMPGDAASLDSTYGVLPHGTGFFFPEIAGIHDVRYDEVAGEIVAMGERSNGDAMEIRSVASLERTFRDDRDIHALHALGLLSQVRRLSFRYGVDAASIARYGV